MASFGVHNMLYMCILEDFGIQNPLRQISRKYCVNENIGMCLLVTNMHFQCVLHHMALCTSFVYLCIIAICRIGMAMSIQVSSYHISCADATSMGRRLLRLPHIKNSVTTSLAIQKHPFSREYSNLSQYCTSLCR